MGNQGITITIYLISSHGDTLSQINFKEHSIFLQSKMHINFGAKTPLLCLKMIIRTKLFQTLFVI
jgi:hypothetical protein